MTRGRAVQVGSAESLFERPAHTFVGHFIGSPGMNFLPAASVRGGVVVLEHPLALTSGQVLPEGPIKLGIRPEYLALGQPGEPNTLPAKVSRVQDIGTYVMVTCEAGEHRLKCRLAPEAVLPVTGDTVHLRVLGQHTCFYQDEVLIA
jgi:glycerol transport system ATP-binding protein